MPKTLVLYIFHEYNDRVIQFINNAIFYDENIDFMVICNNTNMTTIPNLPSYVKTLFRENKGYDFGGWSDALLMNNLYKNYDYFIFTNSSIIGPFLPSYYKGNWTTPYIEGLVDGVKLFGSTINARHKPTLEAHLQSYIFSTDIETLNYLISIEIFTMNNYTSTFWETVWTKEVLMSRKILEKGWNIGSLLTMYKGVDWTFRNKSPDEYNIEWTGDVMYGCWRNNLWNDYELIFIKGNRPYSI